MRVLIITDLEGVSCVDHADMMLKDQEGYQRARAYLMADTNAAVDGAFLGGATHVSVIDGHTGGGNFIPELLDSRAEWYLSSEFVKNPPTRFDALFCVGAHAMAGVENAFLDHTQSTTSWYEYCINGVPQGEMGQQAYCLGHFGIPLVMASGDEAACREAQWLVPNVATACVKTANGRNRATCLPQAEALEMIRMAAADGVRRYREIAPCVLSLPAELKLTYTRSDYCDRAMHDGLQRSGRTLTKRIDKIEGYLDLVNL